MFSVLFCLHCTRDPLDRLLDVISLTSIHLPMIPNYTSPLSFKINDPTDEKTALTRIQACVRELKAWLNQFEIPSVKTVPGGVFLHTPDSLDQGLLDATCD